MDDEIDEPTLKNVAPYKDILEPGDMIMIAILINIRDSIYRMEMDATQRHIDLITRG